MLAHGTEAGMLRAGGGQYAYSLRGVEGPHLQETSQARCLLIMGRKEQRLWREGGRGVIPVPVAQGPLTSRGTWVVT